MANLYRFLLANNKAVNLAVMKGGEIRQNCLVCSSTSTNMEQRNTSLETA